MGQKGILTDLLSDLISELPSILGIANLQSMIAGGSKPRVTESGSSPTEKEREVPTNIFSKEDEAVFSQLERLLSRKDFDTLSRLFDVLAPHQADDFRYYVVKQNQIHEQVVRSRKAVRTGASQKGPEKDEVFEEFDFSLTANLYGPEDVRVKYLSFVAKKIRELDRDATDTAPAVDGAEKVRHLLIRRRFIREKSLQEEATEKASDTWKRSKRRLYRFLLIRKLGDEYRPLLVRFLEEHPEWDEEDAWKRREFVTDIVERRVREKNEERSEGPIRETPRNFRSRIAGRLRRLVDRIEN